MEEKVFANGLIFKLPRDGAPEFVKGSLSVKCKEFYDFMKENVKDGWINLDLKVSQNGKAYAELNTWTPDKKKTEDIPF